MARLFASRAATTLNSITFTSSQSWTVPVGVTVIDYMIGKGQDGEPYTWATETLTMMQSYQNAAATGVDGLVLRSSANSFGTGQASLFSGTSIRFVSYTERSYYTNTGGNTNHYDEAKSAWVKGAAVTTAYTAGGYFTYSNSGNDYVRVSVQVDQGSTVGDNATAFGNTFWGGNATAAGLWDYHNTPVTSGGTYSIVVPSGAYITIQYYT